MLSRKKLTRFLTAMFGVVLFVVLIWRSDPRALLHDFSDLGWGMAGVILLGGISHLVKTYAWVQTFPEGQLVPDFARLLGIRLAGEGISQLSFAGHAGWGPGQLQGELKRGDWYLVGADAELVFNTEPESIWALLIRSVSGLWVQNSTGQFPVLARRQ